MELGPPCTTTTMGYFFAASLFAESKLAGFKPAGYSSQPCKLKPSFCQWMLLASPHAGLRTASREVVCFHSLIAPAQISGGCASDWRIAAAVFPSAAREIAVPHPLAFNWPG